MTNEQARDIVKSIQFNYNINYTIPTLQRTALKMAISALENEEKLEKALHLLAEHTCEGCICSCSDFGGMEDKDKEQIIAECKREAGIEEATHV